MVNINRIDSIIFDLKQSFEDLGNEIKLIAKEMDEINKKIENIESNKEYI